MVVFRYPWASHDLYPAIKSQAMEMQYGRLLAAQFLNEIIKKKLCKGDKDDWISGYSSISGLFRLNYWNRED